MWVFETWMRDQGGESVCTMGMFGYIHINVFIIRISQAVCTTPASDDLFPFSISSTMSNAKEKKYARRMRNQPSNVSFDQGDRTPQGYGRGYFPQQRGKTELHMWGCHLLLDHQTALSTCVTCHAFSLGGTSGQQQRGPHHSQGPHTGGGRGRGDFNEGPQIPKYITGKCLL